jgi:hypothetical protein
MKATAPDQDTDGRESLMGRLTALLGAPLLLGRGAADSVASAIQESPGETRGVRIVPPEHSVKRRG